MPHKGWKVCDHCDIIEIRDMIEISEKGHLYLLALKISVTVELHDLSTILRQRFVSYNLGHYLAEVQAYPLEVRRRTDVHEGPGKE